MPVDDYLFFGGLLCGIAGVTMLVVGFKKAGLF